MTSSPVLNKLLLLIFGILVFPHIRDVIDDLDEVEEIGLVIEDVFFIHFIE